MLCQSLPRHLIIILLYQTQYIDYTRSMTCTLELLKLITRYVIFGLSASLVGFLYIILITSPAAISPSFLVRATRLETVAHNWKFPRQWVQHCFRTWTLVTIARGIIIQNRWQKVVILLCLIEVWTFCCRFEDIDMLSVEEVDMEFTSANQLLTNSRTSARPTQNQVCFIL